LCCAPAVYCQAKQLLLLLLPSLLLLLLLLTSRAASLLSIVRLSALLPGKLNSTQGVWPPCV
jgi:hypothetical protein